MSPSELPQGDVMVVGHQAPRLHHPTSLGTGFIQTLQECRFGTLGPEDLGTVVPAVENMADAPSCSKRSFRGMTPPAPEIASPQSTTIYMT